MSTTRQFPKEESQNFGSPKLSKWIFVSFLIGCLLAIATGFALFCIELFRQ